MTKFSVGTDVIYDLFGDETVLLVATTPARPFVCSPINPDRLDRYRLAVTMIFETPNGSVWGGLEGTETLRRVEETGAIKYVTVADVFPHLTMPADVRAVKDQEARDKGWFVIDDTGWSAIRMAI